MTKNQIVCPAGLWGVGLLPIVNSYSGGGGLGVKGEGAGEVGEVF